MNRLEAIRVLRSTISKDLEANEALDCLIHYHNIAERQVQNTVNKVDRAEAKAQALNAKLKLAESRLASSRRGRKSSSKGQSKSNNKKNPPAK